MDDQNKKVNPKNEKIELTDDEAAQAAGGIACTIPDETSSAKKIKIRSIGNRTQCG